MGSTKHPPGTSHAPTQFASPEFLPYMGRLVNCSGLLAQAVTYRDARRVGTPTTCIVKSRENRANRTNDQIVTETHPKGALGTPDPPGRPWAYGASPAVHGVSESHSGRPASP